MSIIRDDWQGFEILTGDKEFPQMSLNLRNFDGKSALFLAIEHSRAKMIEKLMEFKDMIDFRSSDTLFGNTPLHMACDRNCVLFEGSVNSNDAPRYDVVNSLLSVSPSSVTLEDADEMTAIEYALLSSGDLRVVKMLQRASQKVLRKKHAEEKSNKQQLAGFAPKDKVFTARSA